VHGHEIIPEEKKEVKTILPSKEDSDVVKAKKQAESKPSTVTKKPSTSTTQSKTTAGVPNKGAINTGPAIKKNTGNTIPKRGKDEKDCEIY
jgi:hypothetical protein